MLSLDHIIVLIPYASLQNLPKWITDNFTLSPGGRHADGKTENKLICFRDGSYIELISFANDDPKNRVGHWWGGKKFGIIDFAFTDSTGDATIQYSELTRRLEELKAKDSSVDVDYAEPAAGGRKRPDGVEVKWKVTFPVLTPGYQRGELPFFCHDDTPRSVRVPIEKENVSHPSGAYGVKELNIYLADSKFSTLVKGYSAVLGAENTVPENEASRLGIFSLRRLRKVDGALDPSFKVQIPSKEAQVKAMEERDGSFIGDLVIACQGPGEGNGGHRIDVGEGGIGGVFLDSGKR
ncbi:hypothetical protein BDZ45DRAFT_678371 [Acephala macrosclerotiorum]|nr:hypothetical protein BDZ45DRAFT_678371 [Acephala macrosclerotiorum]